MTSPFIGKRGLTFWLGAILTAFFIVPAGSTSAGRNQDPSPYYDSDAAKEKAWSYLAVSSDIYRLIYEQNGTSFEAVQKSLSRRYSVHLPEAYHEAITQLKAFSKEGHGVLHLYFEGLPPLRIIPLRGHTFAERYEYARAIARDPNRLPIVGNLLIEPVLEANSWESISPDDISGRERHASYQGTAGTATSALAFYRTSDLDSIAIELAKEKDPTGLMRLVNHEDETLRRAAVKALYLLGINKVRR